MPHVTLTVICGNCDQAIGTFTDRIEEKYPFYCPECDMQTDGKYPFIIMAEIAEDDE